MGWHTVFAYGSNMHLGDLDVWLWKRGFRRVRVPPPEPAVLVDHRLVWNYFSPSRGSGAANVEPAPGCSVPGVVLRVDDEGLAALDVKEGYPARYHRTLRRVSICREQAGDAWVYSVTREWTARRTVKPSRTYLQLMIDAAIEYGFPIDYVRWLRSVPTADGHR